MQNALCSSRIIWNSTYKAGLNIREKGLDGLENWQLIKQDMTNLVGTINASKFKEIAARVEYIVDKNDIDHSNAIVIIDGCKLHNSKEADHFVVQLFRIPLLCSYELSKVKFGQIAYNIGQYTAIAKIPGVYDSKVIKFREQHKLNEYSTYCNDE